MISSLLSNKSDHKNGMETQYYSLQEKWVFRPLCQKWEVLKVPGIKLIVQRPSKEDPDQIGRHEYRSNIYSADK